MKHQTIKISVTANSTRRYGVRGYYAIFVSDGKGSSYELKFSERPAKVLYLFAMRHSNGFQRRALSRDNYRELLDIYFHVYGLNGADRAKVRLNSNFDRFVSQGMAALRRGIAASIPNNKKLVEGLTVADPRSTGGLVYIPFVKGGICQVEYGK